MNKLHMSAGLERRREDYQHLTGRAQFVDDIRLPADRPPILHMAVVRSPYAHARLGAFRLEAALALPGVVAAFRGADLVREMPGLQPAPMPPDLKKPERKPLALDKTRFVGDPVAVILAESRAVALDALNLVDVAYEPLPAVSDPEAALVSSAPLLYTEFGTNIAFETILSNGDITSAFAQAEHTVRLRLINQRLAPSSLEPRAFLFDFDPVGGQLTAWVSSQSVQNVRNWLATYLNLDRAQIHVYNADVGGGFGAKNVCMGEEIIAATLAKRLGRPVKWIEGRNENLQAQSQGRGQVNEVEAAFQRDGRLLGLRVSTVADLGAFLTWVTAMVPARMSTLLSGPYRFGALESRVVGVFTNKAPTAPYRGAGRPEATYILERTMDAIARELSLDPAEVRRRNFIPPDAFPCETISRTRYDSGQYELALDTLLELADYAGWRARQQARRQEQHSRLLGLGLATFTELSGDSMPPPPGAPREAATVRIRSDGSVLVQSGVSTTGQGHFTAFAQLAARVLTVPPQQVEVCMNDSALPAFSVGTFGSRVTQVAGSTVLLAAEAVRTKALNVAAHVLEVAPDDLVLEHGQFTVQGAPARALSLGELARLVEEQPDLIEHDAPNPVNGAPSEGLAAWRDFAPAGASFSSGAHLAIVEVDRETGEVELLRYCAVDDCGRVLNDYLAEAQMHGSLAQGIGQALYEQVVYGADGQLLTSSLLDYALPLARQLPAFTTTFVETPSPTNPLGAKGVGEAGCLAAPPAIVNAVLDALDLPDVRSIDMPLSPERVWLALQNG